MKLFDTASGCRRELPRDRSLTLLLTATAPYDEAHVGAGRRLVIFDALTKELARRGYRPRLRVLFLEADERLLTRARVENISPERLADRGIEAWQRSRKALGVDASWQLLRQKDLRERAMELLAVLLARGRVRREEDGIRFRLADDPDYGSLSRQKPEELLAGVSEGGEPGFYLWKRSGAEVPGSGPTPWGWGFFTQSLYSLAAWEDGNLRAGSQSELFPLHENERALRRALGRGADGGFWLHHGPLNLGAEQIRRYVGKDWYLRDILARCPVGLLRYYYLTHHYRSPLAYSPESLAACARSWRRLTALVAGLGEEGGDLPPFLKDWYEQWNRALTEDFNTAKAIGLCHRLRSLLRQDAGAGSMPGSGELKRELQAVLGDSLGVLDGR